MRNGGCGGTAADWWSDVRATQDEKFAVRQKGRGMVDTSLNHRSSGAKEARRRVEELCTACFSDAPYQEHFAVREQSGGVLCARQVHVSSRLKSSRARVIQLGAGQQVASSILATRNQHLAV